MNWKTLKIFAIVVLLAMNFVLLGTVLERNRSISYYDDELVDNAMMLFHESGLLIDESYLREKIEKPAVLLGTFDKSAMTALAKKYLSRGYMASSVTGGMSFENDEEKFIIESDFSFTYYYKEEEERPSVFLKNGDFIEVTQARFTEGPFAVAKNFLLGVPYLGESEKYAYDFTLCGVYSVSGGTVVVVRQTVGGTELDAQIALFLREGRVCAAEGKLAAAFPVEEVTAQTVGLMDILFSEKEALADAVVSKTVSEVCYALAPYFDAEGGFYFVPLCRIVYTDGESRTYNFVSGEFYAESSFFK